MKTESNVTLKPQVTLTALLWLQLLERLPYMGFERSESMVYLSLKKRIMKHMDQTTMLGDKFTITLTDLERAILQRRADHLFSLVGVSNFKVPSRSTFEVSVPEEESDESDGLAWSEA